MQKQFTSRSAFLNARALVALFFCAAACSIVTATLLAFFRSETPANISQRTLTFAERAAYQRAIEDVYWRHRIWPKERPDPKPPLDAVMTQAQLENKVADYLRKSQALEDHWQRPLTAEQLQAEMDRMAKHTKQPEVLRELFEALGNDPFVIAECLARPVLADRLLTNWYAYDQRIHGELKQRAEADLFTHPTVEQMKLTSGKYTEVVFVKSDTSHEKRDRRGAHAMMLNKDEWDSTVQTVAATFNEPGALKPFGLGMRSRQRGTTAFQKTEMLAQFENATSETSENIPVGKISPLQENEWSYYATAVLEKTHQQLKLATVSWVKDSLESWLARAENRVSTETTTQSAGYVLPTVSEGTACIDNTWTTTAGPPDGRYGHTAVWTGSEMIVWGGGYGNFVFRNTGARYDPSTDSWTIISTINAPTARISHTAVWTGFEMIIWGGVDGPFSVANTGARYNPNTDSWIATSTIDAPAPREAHAAVWTGSEMIVWGGTGANYLNTGGKYNPNTDSWTATTTINAPTARYGSTAIWTGIEMVIWGGTNDITGFNTGGRYNPNTNSWTATSAINAPVGRYEHTAVWTGTEMIVWGGYDVDNAQHLNTGGKYNPNTNSWTATSITNAPTGRSLHTAVWIGSQMIVWGGFDVVTITNTGGTYNPATNNWMATSVTNAPTARGSHTAVWTGTEMIIWGGEDDSGNANTGGRYNPGTNSWTTTNTYNAPAPRGSHTAVWTGSEMIVWGGVGVDYLNTGGRYTPGTDTWVTTGTTNAPTGRYEHTAVWTGSEMIVWGGSFYNNGYQFLNTGGRYNPSADAWTPTSLTNAPSARGYHTALWDGNEMIIWGGTDEFTYFNTGAKYNPDANSWTNTAILNAPTGRELHTAVWSGTEMIVWGGFGVSNYANTGARYNPNTDNWTAITTTNAPSGRVNHTAVWTGNEMIVWGGHDENFVSVNTGGRYNSGADSWSGMNSTNAPDAREFHTAVWTGNEMIVWGGAYSDVFSLIPFNSGGRYNPDTDSWTATSLTNAPDPRYTHSSIWTGSEMIVWGGTGGGTLNTGGRYCAQGGPSPTPTPTPTPCTGRCEPTPRPRPTPAPRP